MIIFLDCYLVFFYGLRYILWKSRKKFFGIIVMKWFVGVILVGGIIFFYMDFEDIGDVFIVKYILQYEDRGILLFLRIILLVFLIVFCIVFYLSLREIKKIVLFRKGLKGLDMKCFQDLKVFKIVCYIIVCYVICFLFDII